MLTSEQIRSFLTHTLDRTDFAELGERYQGKVRDVYSQGDRNILIATDRQSAFDIKWCTIPLKGQVLNQLSAWWFERVKDVMPAHVLAVPDPNVMVVKNLKMLKVEIVVRAYLTGSTVTSAWVNYEKGVRNFCGNALPDGMRKNEKLDRLIITPTTKAEEDELLTPQEIIERGLATEGEWKEITEKAFALFRRGQEVALKRGLILVDTKYEMGYDPSSLDGACPELCRRARDDTLGTGSSGVLTIADEVHTPDSSRYWVAETYEDRLARGLEPEALDKEFFRLWVRSQGFDPRRPEETRPHITDDVRIMLAQKYIELYERMTGESFQVESGNVLERIRGNLENCRMEVMT